MAVKPIEQTFDIGTDAYGRHVKATKHPTYDGKIMWRIRAEPSSQRDDGERMDALTDNNILLLAEAVEAARKGG